MLKIYNTQTRIKEHFTPIDPNKVGLYVCGMTVYDFCHVGHARVMTFFDTVVKYLKTQGYEVNYVRNITDIDDKIINRANENKEDFNVLVNRFIKAMHEDSDKLLIDQPTVEPKATESMAEIIAMIALLIDKNVAYTVANGDVYFAVDKFADYGKLSGKNIEDLQAGARVEVDTIKHNPVDFALWKSAKPNEPSWDSPWGQGRPGWHIECSAMSGKYLGDKFDIHGGGMDLIFPHHENEVAQSEACIGHKHVNTWMHVGFVRVDDEKMSKSLKNFFTIREVLEKYSAEVMRMFLLSSHYRSPLNYTVDNLENSKAGIARLYLSLRNLDLSQASIVSEWQEKFEQKMNDDFNTPEALAVMFDLARAVNKATGDLKNDLAYTLKSISNVLGLLQNDPEDHLKFGVDASKVNQLLIERTKVRADKNWARADEIRDELEQMNIIIEDSGDGTTWRQK